MNYLFSLLLLCTTYSTICYSQQEDPMGNTGEWLFEMALDQNVAMFKKKSILVEYYENEKFKESRRIDYIDSNAYKMYGLKGEMVGYSQLYFYTKKGFEDALSVRAERSKKNKKNQTVSYVDAQGNSFSELSKLKDSSINTSYTRVRQAGDTVEWLHGRIIKGKDVVDICYGTVFKTISNPLMAPELQVGLEYSIGKNKAKKEWVFSLKKEENLYRAIMTHRNQETLIGFIETNKWGRILKIYDRNMKLKYHINQAY